MSKQYELVFSIVEQCDGHISAQEVYDRARQTLPNISFGTVYRNLGKLCDDKRIREVPVTHGASKFEMIQKPHGHLICIRCGSIRDFPVDDIDSLSRVLDTEILSYSCCVTHICSDCKELQAKV